MRTATLAVAAAAVTLAACDVPLTIPNDKPGSFQGFYMDTKRGCVVHSKTDYLRYWAAHSANNGMLSQGQLCPEVKEQMAALVAAEVKECEATMLRLPGRLGCQYAGPSRNWLGAPQDNRPPRNLGSTYLIVSPPEVRRGPSRLPPETTVTP